MISHPYLFFTYIVVDYNYFNNRVLRDQNDLDELSVVSLSNTIEDYIAVLKWLRPCPKVEWASELKRNKRFLVNLESEMQDKLSVTIMNPDASNGSYRKDITGRLKHIYLKFRKIGSIQWNYAKTHVATMDKKDQNLDFKADYAEE